MKNSNSPDLDDKFDPFAPMDYPINNTVDFGNKVINPICCEDNYDFPAWEDLYDKNPSSPYCWYNNERRSYLKVPLADIEKIGVFELISGASYMNSDSAYLDEDGDAYHFIDALTATGKEFNPNNILVNDLSYLNGLPHFGYDDENDIYYSYQDSEHPDLIAFIDHAKDKEEIFNTNDETETPDISFLEKRYWDHD